MEEKEGQLVAIVLLGDLNARKASFGPTDKGRPPQAAYRLIHDGQIHADDVDWEHSAWCPDEWREVPGGAYENGDADSVCICCQDRGIVEGYGVCPLCEGLGMREAPLSQEHLRMELHLPLPLIDPNGHVEVTNYTAYFQECIDYTLLDARALRAVRPMVSPPLERLRAETALPSSFFPSDHIPVWVDATYA